MNDKTAQQARNKYRHIVAWGKMMGSYEYFVTGQCIEAMEDNAPVDAIYKRDDTWVVADDKVKQKLSTFI